MHASINLKCMVLIAVLICFEDVHGPRILYAAIIVVVECPNQCRVTVQSNGNTELIESSRIARMKFTILCKGPISVSSNIYGGQAIAHVPRISTAIVYKPIKLKDGSLSRASIFVPHLLRHTRARRTGDGVGARKFRLKRSCAEKHVALRSRRRRSRPSGLGSIIPVE